MDPGLRDRVLKNIAESNAARKASSFELLTNFEKIERARQAQLVPGYGGQDVFTISRLHRGELVYGGVPGQSNWYTDVATVKASGLNGKKLFETLQVAPHPKYGYRPTIRVYRVTSDVEVPGGWTLNNPQNGKGGGRQFYLEDLANLQYLRDFQLK